MSHYRLGTLLGLLVSLGTFAWAGEESAVWCAGESLKVKAEDPAPGKSLTWDPATHTVTLGGARNEYVAFQAGVHAPADGLKDVTVEPAALKGPRGAELPLANIELFVEHYLDVTVSSRTGADAPMPYCTPGWQPTQLVPLTAKKYGAPFDVAAGRNQAVWADLYLPEDAVPGEYSGVFKVKSGETLLGELNIHLTVWNFTLPQQTHFRSFLYTGPENLRWGMGIKDIDSDKFKQVEDRFFQMAHQHRLNFNPSAGDIVREIGERYKKYYDGSAFHLRVGRGVGQNVLVMTPEGNDEAAVKANTRSIVNLYQTDHFPAYLFAYIWDEPHSDKDFAFSKQRCEWVHQAGDRVLKTYVTTPQFEKYAPGDVDIFGETKAADVPKVLERGSSVWAVNQGYGGGPYTDSPGVGGRSIVWMNWKMHVGGWQFWDCCYWVDKQNRKHKENGHWVRDMTFAQTNADPAKYLTNLWTDPLTFDETRKVGYPARDAIRINGDGVLFYPGLEVGIEGPIASFAMKSLRRGAQDYEYLWLLKDAGQEAELGPIVDSVCPEPGKINLDPEAWDRARLKLAELLNKGK